MEPSPEEGDVDVVFKPIDDCDAEICGNGNSPVFGPGNIPFHELNFNMSLSDALGAEPSSGRGFKIYYVEKKLTPTTSVPCTFEVKDARVTAKCQGIVGVVQGQDLANVWIWVKATHGPDDKQIIRFAEEGFANYWPKPKPNMPQVQTPWYWAQRAIPNINGTITWKDLCSGPFPDERETRGVPPKAMVVFEGDRINPITKTVTKDALGGFFTLACNQNNPMKLHVAGFSTPGSKATDSAITEAKQTTFTMMTSAAYCAGKAYTVHGQKYDWRTADGRLPFVYNNPVLEVRWNQFGAACMAVTSPANPNPKRGPRVAVTQTPASIAVFGDKVGPIIEKIQYECKSNGHGHLNDCPIGPSGPNDMLGHYLISANPLVP